jgi:hypothetical protein
MVRDDLTVAASSAGATGAFVTMGRSTNRCPDTVGVGR